ncbi:MAG: hypothetical protein PHF60_00795 [Candidatus ainarchaeum sp.]|nr:hypothetical protein [Candidatus ainarchaeum sp.]
MIIAILVLGLILAPLAFAANCAASSYAGACSMCSFDAQGRMADTCWQGYKLQGTTCMSSKYPIMATAYSQGKCPQVDECASELQSCIAQYSSGDDKADCQEGSLAVCYAASDECVKSAAVKCGELESPCPGSSTAFILLFAGLLFVRMKND